MAVRFARLRIAGFKSFAEAASLEILPGLTGIVGPNGCGKSNVVEALRWAMGESSARSLRGGEMDDLIFAGTAGRAARTLAEVTLTLQEAQGVAPPPFHDQPELQISRRIERGAGSSYHINGREARARDVQTLFADLASGARSSAMVSQGRVASIVDARPAERRSILEEAAGITGLHGRRHEAELKLRATESNLVRAEDSRRQLEARLAALSAQAAQAARYREIAAGLRAAEAGVLALLGARARLELRQAREAAAAGDAALEQAVARARAAADAERRLQDAAEGPRGAEEAARTALERQRIGAESLAQEEARAEQEAALARTRLAQARAEAEAAAARLADSEAACARLAGERAAAAARGEALPEEMHALGLALQQAQTDLATATARLSEALGEATAARARAERLDHERDAAALRLARLDAERAATLRAHEAALAAMPQQDEVAALQEAETQAVAMLEQARIAAEQAGEARIETARAADAARLEAEAVARSNVALAQAEQNAERTLQRLRTEAASLRAGRREAEAARAPPGACEAAAARVETLHAALNAAREGFAAAEGSRHDAERAHAEAGQRLREAEHLVGQLEAAQARAETAFGHACAQHARLVEETDGAALPDAGELRREHDRLHQAQATLEACARGLSAAESDRQAAEQAAAQAAREHAAAQAEQARIAAEMQGLSGALLGEADARGWPPLSEALAVPPGLERALAAVLAEGLHASLDHAAPMHWRELPACAAPALPASATALSGLIEAPAALGRLLDHAGLIEEARDGERLQPELAAGQCLVMRDGSLWRWDGLRLQADEGASQPVDARAALLAQRHRLREAQAALEPATRRAAELAAHAERAAAGHARHAAEAIAARRHRDQSEQALAEIRERISVLSAHEAAARARLQAILPQRERAAELREEAASALDEAIAQAAFMPDLDGLRAALHAALEQERAGREAQGRAAERRQEAERALQAARDQAAALLARHEAAESRCAALLPAEERVQAELAATEAEASQARTARETAQSPDGTRRALDLAVAAAERARSDEAALRLQVGEAERRREQARGARSEAASRGAVQSHRIEALRTRLEAVVGEHRRIQAECQVLHRQSAELPDAHAQAAACEAAREAQERAATREAACREARAQRAAEAGALEGLRETLATAQADWSRRLASARSEHGAAQHRLEAEGAQCDRLAQAPEAARRRRVEQAQAQAAAEQSHAQARAALHDAERAMTESRQARREADAGLAEASEAKRYLHGRIEQAQTALAQLAPETRAGPDAPPSGQPEREPHDLSEAAEAGLRRRIARLAREREELGPVNLRADIESAELSQHVDATAREHAELQAAIGRLRGSITSLNREGRERLLAAFNAVDGHFQALFARMFNGGRARLGMVGDDDPLCAGLEIYAQPPGKKLATLSLLSGGEQALTALSLIFAVFCCNPAPVCVLDEVDAPLDDANVARFVALLADMVAQTGTRFLVVTHHQLTMAHMDRLYGVTMQERGVSRLLSVDLSLAR